MVEIDGKTKVSTNLRYLDLAVMLNMWRERKLDELLFELLPCTEGAVPIVDVITALDTADK